MPILRLYRKLSNLLYRETFDMETLKSVYERAKKGQEAKELEQKAKELEQNTRKLCDLLDQDKDTFFKLAKSGFNKCIMNVKNLHAYDVPYSIPYCSSKEKILVSPYSEYDEKIVQGKLKDLFGKGVRIEKGVYHDFFVWS